MQHDVEIKWRIKFKQNEIFFIEPDQVVCLTGILRQIKMSEMTMNLKGLTFV